jgi:hypothetical protein
MKLANSTARANLNRVENFMTNTIAASKYIIPKRPKSASIEILLTELSK